MKNLLYNPIQVTYVTVIMNHEKRLSHFSAIWRRIQRALYGNNFGKIEEAYKEPLANAFDLICGTSIGGILALGLAAEIPSRNLKNIFIENGKEIFSPKLGFFQKFLFKHTKLSSSAAYSPKKLEQILKRHFGDKKIGDLKHRVLIPTVNCETGLGQFIKTPHHVSFKFDWKWSVVDAALATSAAPTYFPIFKNQVGRFVDGALVGNAPGLLDTMKLNIFSQIMMRN